MYDYIISNFNVTYFYVILAAGFSLLFVWHYVSQGKFVSGGSTLRRHSRDLTALAAAKKLDPVIGRDLEIGRVIQTLCRRTKNNPLLIGRAGVGKTAIAEGLAQRIAQKKVPRILLGKRVLSLDLTGILAGTKYRGEFEKRLKEIADEIIAARRTIILFIDEIHTLADAGGAEGSIDADDILKPALARGDLQVIGATTPGEYAEFIKKDVTLDRRLNPILVSEPSKEETLDILKGIRSSYESFHRVTITDSALKTAVELSGKYIKDRAFPDKAIDLMDEAASRVGIAAGERENKNVTAVDVKSVFAEWRRKI